MIVERVTEARLVHCTRFGLDGHVQADDTLALPDLEGWRRHSEEDIPTSVNEWATTWSYSKPREESSDSAMGTAQRTEVLRVQCHIQRGHLRLKKDSFIFEYAALQGNIFFWNDTAYFHTALSSELTFLTLIDFSTSSLEFNVFMGRELERESWGLGGTRGRQFRNDGGMAQSIFLGDQRFLVNVCRHGFFIWVFDKGHGMIEYDAKY